MCEHLRAKAVLSERARAIEGTDLSRGKNSVALHLSSIGVKLSAPEPQYEYH